jgi:hypothetical protein
MPRRKREDGQPGERSLKMPAWLSAEVETISGLAGMTQQKVTAILASLVFPETLASELRQRVYAQLGELLLPGQVHAGHGNVQGGHEPQADPEHYTAHQLEQAALFGVDPADVVIPAEVTLDDLRRGGEPALPVGEGPDPDDIPF